VTATRLDSPSARPHWQCQNVSNILWAYATIGHRDTGLFEACIRYTLACGEEFTEQEIANVAWSFAKFEHYSGALMHKLGQLGRERIDKLALQHISLLTWAQQKVGQQGRGGRSGGRVLVWAGVGCVCVVLAAWCGSSTRVLQVQQLWCAWAVCAGDMLQAPQPGA
jgi:hypothetical protein